MEDGSAATIRTDAPASDTPPVAWRDLRDWLELVDQRGGLARVKAEIDTQEEMSAITLLATQKDTEAPALLFEKPKGDKIGARVLMNMLGSSVERYALSVGLDPKKHLVDLIRDSRDVMRRRIKPVRVRKEEAPVNEVVLTGDDVDLTLFPAPKFWPGDGGSYIGSGDITFTADPVSGRINVGVYRQMLHSRNRVGMWCSPGKHARLDREAWWKQGKPCEVVAAYGIDPALFMVGAQVFAYEQSELEVAGGLMGKPVELTDGVFTSLPIPARAEIVIEGLLHPNDNQMEGPLGEFTGYYGNDRSEQPVIEVKAVHYRKSPILTGALMANYPSCESGAYFAIQRAAKVWDDLDRIGVPGIRGVYCHPAAATGWGMTIVSVQQRYAGHVAQVLALTAQCPAAAYFTKWIIAVDDDVDPTDINQVLWAMSTRCDPVEDLDFLRNTWSTGLDPSKFPREARPYGSKALINACKSHRYIKEFPATTRLRKEMYDQVLAKWSTLGIPVEPGKINNFHE
jgi:4-hydroxy-3-polyprenylbenzoate decarboxylase